MTAPPGSDPIADDELLYRRIPVSLDWYTEGELSPTAFRPHRDDQDGISLYRHKYIAAEELASRGKSARGYYVAVLRAGDLRRHGIVCVATPRADEPGHVSIPALNYETRKGPEAERLKGLIARKLTLRVDGPFESSHTA